MRTAPPPPPRPRRRSARGALACLAMFALGGAVLWGLFLAPRASSPRSPGLPWGAPPRALRFVSFDCNGLTSDVQRAAVAAIRARDPDFVMLQRVPAEDVLGFVEGLRFQPSHYTQLFQRTGPGGRDETGCLLLSRHRLYDARGVGPGGARGACLGTWAVAAVDGVRFAVVSARAEGTDWAAALERLSREAGGSPVVVGISPPPAASASRPNPENWAATLAGGPVLADVRWRVVAAGPVEAAETATFADLAGAPTPTADPAKSERRAGDRAGQ